MVTPKVDQKTCIGCGACVALCPPVFELGSDGKSHVKDPKACDKCDCEAARDACPTGSITLS